MSTRLRLARFLLQLGTFIETLPVVVMKPVDLVEFSRQTYAKPEDVESWAEDALVDSGLSTEELELLADVPTTSGDLLLLGVGGGREAIPLAKMGFHVTGVDYVPAMVERAKENAAQRGVGIEGMVQEISHLEVPAEAYDLVWISKLMYSCVPTRARRVEMVRRIARTLKPGGFFLCQFRRDPGKKLTGKDEKVRKLIAASVLGNREYEEGDILWGNIEFVHSFNSDEAVKAELEEGGLSVLRLQISKNPYGGGAVCKKLQSPR